jgi:AcrR family transcriptional regulator
LPTRRSADAPELTSWDRVPSSPYLRLGPREKQRAATRGRIYEAALAEFRHTGFERASVADIARAASVSRPSFYAHFPTKEHILLELQWRLSLEVVRRIEGRGSLRETLDAFVDALIDCEESVGDPEVFRATLVLWARQPAHLDLDEVPMPVADALLERFIEGRERGELRASLDPQQAAPLCLSSLFGALLVNRGPQDARTAMETLFSLFLED